MELGEKIRQVRVMRGLSQENLAEELGLSHVAYGKMERGKQRINTKQLKTISRVLRVGVEDLLSDEGNIAMMVSEPNVQYGNNKDDWKDKYIALLEEHTAFLKKYVGDHEHTQNSADALSKLLNDMSEKYNAKK